MVSRSIFTDEFSKTIRRDMKDAIDFLAKKNWKSTDKPLNGYGKCFLARGAVLVMVGFESCCGSGFSPNAVERFAPTH